ncbi:hypothetical protein FAZ78_13985 [Cereibacter changlensis]|uniref:Uncharacterized protein n=1 Tax=Cereibacter changlensis TaxID=402884 RepID=A0A4U0YTD3_9RHOB|nr:DUF6065 family protein [Cereibacter changlensis]TKA95962.1 hypothetical protein FAZ78_13985 [Cereibacter changlensis]
MSFFRKPAPTIRFLCEPADEGVIAPPVPAKSYTADWFRRLAAVDEAKVSTTDTGLTIKRCLPFLDAMTTGWIIPLAATVRLDVKDGGRRVEAGWDFDRTMVSFHGAHQLRGNPWGERAACKFHNYWSIVTPPGWSCLFLDPLNRPNGLFEVLAGVVDTDTYRAPVHFPFIPTGPDGLHVIEKGSPLIQVIPFRRDAAGISAEIRAETPAEAAERSTVTRNTRAASGWYRTVARARR